MSGDWKEGFKRALIDALVVAGHPVRERPDIYGWEDYIWEGMLSGRAHPKRQAAALVGIDYGATVYREADWREFAGTFFESNHVYGVDIDLVLLDGTRYAWRYSGTLSALIGAVLTK